MPLSTNFCWLSILGCFSSILGLHVASYAPTEREGNEEWSGEEGRKENREGGTALEVYQHLNRHH